MTDDDWSKLKVAVPAVLASIGATCTAGSFVCGFLASRYPTSKVPWLKVAQRFSDFGLRVHELGMFLGNLLGGAPATEVKALSKRPSPSFAGMCPACGQPQYEVEVPK
jgi:hypothetical protein